MTATQPDSDGTATQAKSGLTRRGVMRKTAIGIGATATAGYGIASDRGPVGNAQAFPPALLPAAAAVGYLAYGEFYAGPDDEEVSDSLEWQSHVNEFTRAREDSLTLDQTLASLRRDVQLVENKAREEAIFAIYEQGVDSGTEEQATTAAEDAINDAYAVVERAIIDTFRLRTARLGSVIQMFGVDPDDHAYLGSHPDFDGNLPLGGAATVPAWDEEDQTHTLLDGTTMSYIGYYHDDDGYLYAYDPVTEPERVADANHVSLSKPDHNDYETVDEPLDVGDEWATIVDAAPYRRAAEDLYAAHSSMMDEIQSMVDTYYQPAVDGEIDLHNLIGPAHLSDTASTAEDYQEAAMALRAMGYPMSDQVCTVSITDDEGETHERIGRLSWTAHSGNMLTVGTELNPDNIVGSVFFAYNEPQDDGSIVGQTRELNRPFTIETAEGSDGVSFEDRTLAEADTQLTNEEIQELFAEHYAANEEARENVHDTATDGGGAGGFLDGDASDIRTLGIVAGGAALAALLFGTN